MLKRCIDKHTSLIEIPLLLSEVLVHKLSKVNCLVPVLTVR